MLAVCGAHFSRTDACHHGRQRPPRIWDAPPARKPAARADKFVQWATFSHDGKRIATAGEDHVVRVWDADTRKELLKLPHRGNVTHVAFSPDGEHLVSSSDDQTARLWRVGAGVAESRRLVARLHHNDIVKWGAFSPDNERVLTVSDDKTARVWSVADGRLTLPPLVHGSNVRRYAAFSVDGCMIFTASDDNTGRVWSAHDGSPRYIYRTTVSRIAGGSRTASAHRQR